MDIQDSQKILNSANDTANNHFTKAQTVIIVIAGIIISWGGVIFLFGASQNVSSGVFSGGAIAPQVSGNNFSGLPQDNNLSQAAGNAPAIFSALASRLPTRGIITEIKDTELLLKVSAVPGSSENSALRRAVFNAKTKFAERTLKPLSEISIIMQNYAGDLTARPNEDIPFPKTYLSELEISKDDLKIGDTVVVFAKDKGGEVITADIVARITNP